MVDALIKASEEQKCVSAEPLPGAGRDLVPFDFEAHNHQVDGKNSNTPLLVGVDPRLRAHQVCAPQVPTGGHAAAAAKLSNSAPLEATAKGNNNNKGKSNKNKNNNRNDNVPKYAGASFTNSPDPDAVPLPSFLKTIPGAQAAMARRNSSHNSLSSSAGSSPADDDDGKREQLDAEFALSLATTSTTTTSATTDEWSSTTRKFARRWHPGTAATPSSTQAAATDTGRFERSVW